MSDLKKITREIDEYKSDLDVSESKSKDGHLYYPKRKRGYGNC